MAVISAGVPEFDKSSITEIRNFTGKLYRLGIIWRLLAQ
jgi:hypothetical protein